MNITIGIALSMQMKPGAGGGAPAPLITNGTFDTDTDWTKGNNVVISDGKAQTTGFAGAIVAQNVTLEVGATYSFSFDFVKSGGAKIRLDNSTTDGGNTVYTSPLLTDGQSGTLTGSFVATGNGISLGASENFFQGSIDNVVLTKTS